MVRQFDKGYTTSQKYNEDSNPDNLAQDPH